MNLKQFGVRILLIKAVDPDYQSAVDKSITREVELAPLSHSFLHFFGRATVMQII